MEPETAEAVRDLTRIVQADPQPSRSRAMGFLVVSSALSVVVGGAALMAAGSPSLILVGGAALAFPGKYLWEVYKRTDSFSEFSVRDAKKLDKLINLVELSATEAHTALMRRMASFVNAKQSLIYRLGELRPELAWVRRFVPKQPELISKDDSEILDFFPQSSPLKALAAFEGVCGEYSDPTGQVDRKLAEAKFGRNEVRDLVALGLLQLNSTEGSLWVTDDPVRDYDIALKNSAAKTRTMGLVRAELMKNFSMPAKDVGSKVEADSGRSWSDTSRQRYGNAFKVWARWIDPHLIDPTKSTYQYDHTGSASLTSGPGRRALEIHPMKKSQVSELVRQGSSIPTIAKTLSMSERNVKRAMSDEDRKYRQDNRPLRAPRSELNGKLVPRWSAFDSLGLEEKRRLASIWYSNASVNEVVRPEFEKAGAPSGFSRHQLNRLLGPRDASRPPDWYARQV
jgi:hypothetical protein